MWLRQVHTFPSWGWYDCLLHSWCGVYHPRLPQGRMYVCRFYSCIFLLLFFGRHSSGCKVPINICRGLARNSYLDHVLRKKTDWLVNYSLSLLASSYIQNWCNTLTQSTPYSWTLHECKILFKVIKISSGLAACSGRTYFKQVPYQDITTSAESYAAVIAYIPNSFPQQIPRTNLKSAP